MKSPVAFFIYKRSEYTGRVWAEIRKARPPVLLIVADGPRDEQDQIKCEAARAVVELVDWPCDVRRNYAAVNMGCRDRMASGLNWVFEEVEEAIILEDDCLPSQSFFLFCEQLLDYYRHDPRVMHVGGSNFQLGRVDGDESYYFSKYSHVWGWATWRRAWNHYDLNVRLWPLVKRHNYLRAFCETRNERQFWTNVLDRQFRAASKTWDYSWVFSVWANHGLAICPAVNLVSNIGTGSDSTHQQDDQWYMKLPLEEIAAIKHPALMMINVAADRRTCKSMFTPRLWDRMQETLLNPWFYTACIRKIPMLGEWWGKWRDWCKK